MRKIFIRSSQLILDNCKNSKLIVCIKIFSYYIMELLFVIELHRLVKENR